MQHDFIATIMATALQHPHRKALSKGKQHYTYYELSEAINNVANNLVSNGMKPGDRVFFSVRPDPKGLILALGVIAGGGVIVFADPSTNPTLFKDRVSLTTPTIVAAESILYFANTKLGKYVAKKKHIAIPDYSGINANHYYAGFKFPGMPKSSKNINDLYKQTTAPLERMDPTQESILVFTSGTTSDPKCVRHSRNSIGAGMQAFVDKCGIDKDSLIYTDHFNFGITALTVGGHWEIPENPPAKNPEGWVKDLAKREVTHTFLVPSDVTLMLNEIEKQGISINLGSLSTGAAPVLPALIKRVNEVLPETEVYAIYGMTEMLPIAIINGRDKIAYEGGDIAGKLQPNVTATVDTSVTIANIASHDTTDLNAITTPIGELLLSGEGLMLGYLGQESSRVHRTGDMATVDDNGNLVLLGRIKDMLIRANKNIYPGLYEPLISLIPGVEDSAIVGVQDKYGEDIVVLYVVPTDKSQSEKEFKKQIAPGLLESIDGDAQPDVIIMISEMLKSGRSNKIDRKGLSKKAESNYRVELLLKAQERS